MQRALITGASRGLGLVIATALAGRGYSLVVTSRTASELEAAAEVLRVHGTRVDVAPGDITDPAHRADLARHAGTRLDVLVNNASALGPMAPLAAYPLDALPFETNVVAPLALVQATLPALRVAGGLVVNITSDAAAGAYEGWGGYGLTKAALELASATLAGELRPDGVSVVTVDPGDMRTRMHQEAFAGEDISDRPPPDVTLPFWTWLFGQRGLDVSGRRYRAQSDVWEAA